MTKLAVIAAGLVRFVHRRLPVWNARMPKALRLKVVPNIPVGHNRNGPFDLIFKNRTAGILSLQVIPDITYGKEII